jgi:uncharacterized membrane protein
MSRRLTIWALVANMLILIGAGHGVGPLGLLEIFILTKPSSFVDKLTFSLHESYDHLLLSAMILTCIGQIALVGTLVVNQALLKLVALIIALVLMYIGVLYLSVNMQENTASMMSFVTSIPFLVLSLIGLIRQFRICVAPIK